MPKAKLPFREFEWTPKLAYAVGLLATDGNLSKDGRHNRIARSYNDGYAKWPCYRIQFATVGLKPAKTHTLGPLKIPEEYFRDFLRGHLDGDGSIITYMDHYNAFKNPKYVYTRLWVKVCSASRAHIEWIRGTTFRLLGIRGHLVRGKPGRREIAERFIEVNSAIVASAS